MTTSSALPPNAPLSRFLTNRSHYSVNKGRVRKGAFMPHHRQLSVFQVGGLVEPEIWTIGKNVCEVSQRTLHGRGDLKVADVVCDAVSVPPLKVVPDEDPPRHANIVGWPEEKDAQNACALELAARAELVLYTED